MTGMNAMPNVLVIGDAAPSWVAQGFETAGFPVRVAPFAGFDPAAIQQQQLVIVAPGPASLVQAQGLCRRWRIELGETHVPILWLNADGKSGLDALEAGADAVLPANVPPEFLMAQAKAMLRSQHVHKRLLERAGESTSLNQRLQQAYQQIDNDLELARRIHRGFLPKKLPEVGESRFAVCYRPRSRIGGDFYDVARLDERHIAFYVADAMGRGLPASSLLSIFVKRSLLMKEITKDTYRLPPPAEVLNRLNHDLLALSLPEPPFVTMSYFLLDCSNGSVVFARAAHPHPLHVPANGEPEYWHASGSLLGVFESEYTEQKKQLQPGDKLVVYTDGVHAQNAGGPGSTDDKLFELARKHRGLALQPFIDQLARELLENSRHPEDFTLLALEYK